MANNRLTPQHFDGGRSFDAPTFERYLIAQKRSGRFMAISVLLWIVLSLAMYFVLRAKWLIPSFEMYAFPAVVAGVFFYFTAGRQLRLASRLAEQLGITPRDVSLATQRMAKGEVAWEQKQGE